MTTGTFCMVALALVAFVPTSTARITTQNCICQQGPGIYTRGKMVSASSCYVLGVGYCGRFVVDHSGRRLPARRISASRPRFGQSLRSSQRRRFNPFRRNFTQQQRARARQATQQQLVAQRQLGQNLLRSGFGTVRRGTPSAALAAEKRADAKSLALGQQALAQILYLQNLVGTGR